MAALCHLMHADDNHTFLVQHEGISRIKQSQHAQPLTSLGLPSWKFQVNRGHYNI